MGCEDCDKKPIQGVYPEQPVMVLPSGYTGNRLHVLGLTLSDNPNPDAYYSLPKVTSDGSIIYAQEREDQSPPPEINGYIRCVDDPFRFAPLWDECLMRIVGTTYNRVCGYIDVVMICNHPDCQYAGKRLTVLECESCPHRLEALDA